MASKKLPDRRTLSRAVKDRAARTRRLLEWARGELTDTIRMSEETMQESATGAGLARAHNMLCCCESRMAEVASQLRTKDLREPAYRDGPDALRVVAFALKESYYDRKAWNPMAHQREPVRPRLKQKTMEARPAESNPMGDSPGLLP